MAYGQRDRFLQAIVIFTTSEKAKELALGDRQRILVDIRNIYAPDITDAEWTELAKGVNEFNFVVSDSVKNNEVPVIDRLLSKPKLEPEPKIEDEDEDGVTEEPDYSEPEPQPEPKPIKEPERFGRFIKPKEMKTPKINTSALRGLLKPKKKDENESEKV